MPNELKYGRSLRQLLRGVANPMHVRSLSRARVYERPLEMIIWRYALGRGSYPTDIRLRVSDRVHADIQIRSHYDLLTVQEIFLWQCYPCRGDERVVLDLGANIGVSMVYFLSHAPEAYVIGVEPLEGNILQAKANLRSFTARSRLIERAVMDYDGTVEIGVEPTGRYSGIGLTKGEPRTIECIDINALVLETSETRGRIDLLKVDVEGAESSILGGMTKEAYGLIDRIAIEGDSIPYARLNAMGFTHYKHLSGVHWFNR